MAQWQKNNTRTQYVFLVNFSFLCRKWRFVSDLGLDCILYQSDHPILWLNYKILDGVINWKHFPRYWPFVGKGNSFFYQRLDMRLNKQARHWWFEAQARSLWRHCDVQLRHPNAVTPGCNNINDNRYSVSYNFHNIELSAKLHICDGANMGFLFWPRLYCCPGHNIDNQRFHIFHRSYLPSDQRDFRKSFRWTLACGFCRKSNIATIYS